MPAPSPQKIIPSSLFYRSRLRIASWYAGVMGIILALLGLGVYRAISHAHEITADRELKSVAESIYEGISPTIASPSQLSELPSQVFPDLCLLSEACLVPLAAARQPSRRANQYSYYIRIVDPAGKLLATGGDRPVGLPLTMPAEGLQAVEDEYGRAYHQVAIPLATPLATPLGGQVGGQDLWAYLLVGRSFQDFDSYLSVVRWALFLGFVVAIALVAIASWWLAALAMRPIYESYQQIQQFTADAAHELRTPLAAIQATVESVLRVSHLSEVESKETLTVISRQNKRLTSLVSDLLLLSRFDSEQQVLEKQRCCLPDILNDIAEEMSAFALSKQISLAIDIQTQPQLSTLGNEEQLYRLVINLVNNALTYTPSGGQVTLSLEKKQQDAIISVKDTGIGITLEEQRKIFARFYRVDAARSRQTGNSGLGLAIASAIAKAHGGNLTVTSQPNAGSTFTLALPA